MITLEEAIQKAKVIEPSLDNLEKIQAPMQVIQKSSRAEWTNSDKEGIDEIISQWRPVLQEAGMVPIYGEEP